MWKRKRGRDNQDKDFLDLMDQIGGQRGRKRVYPKLNEFTKKEICTDDIDKDILMHLIESDGRATISQITMVAFGDSAKHRKTHDRLERMNKRSIERTSRPILDSQFSPDTTWWLIDPSSVMS